VNENAGAALMMQGMKTKDNFNISAAVAPTVPLSADDPRSPENVERRHKMGIAERDAQGRLLPGSRIAGAGRKPDHVSVTALARVHTEAAVHVLTEVMADPKAAPAAKVAAAQALLDRAWGKAPVTVDLQVRARFDDFLREVGISAVYEREHPANPVIELDSTLADETAVASAGCDEAGQPEIDDG
jgi:hypothetical protein